MKGCNLRWRFLLPLLLASCAWAQYGAPRYTVVRADYGSGNTWRDVTGQVATLVRNNQLNFRVSNSALGVDPAPGAVKQLRLQVRSERGDVQTITFRENDTVNLTIINGSGWGGGGNRGPGFQEQGLRILRAEYGVGERLVDVTALLNSQVRNGRLTLRITNETMGRDPAEERRKQLTVWYVYKRRTATVTVPEKSVLTLPSSNPSYVGNLLIMRAQYGADYRFRDVTSLLNSQIQGDRLNLRITNDSMAGDPAPDRPKILTVSYQFNGQPAQVVVNERDTLTLPGAGNGGGWNWPGGGGQLQIMRASFGAGSRNVDVTSQLAAQVQRDRLNMRVDRGTMGSDPAPGQTKRLNVIYLWQGLRYETNVPEGGTVSLP
jgi:hypothetical protein